MFVVGHVCLGWGECVWGWGECVCGGLSVWQGECVRGGASVFVVRCEKEEETLSWLQVTLRCISCIWTGGFSCFYRRPPQNCYFPFSLSLLFAPC